MNIIFDEIKTAPFFAVEMDSTMDISSFDQCAIVARYVLKAEVFERLIGGKQITSSTGESLFNTLKDTFREGELDMNKCIADSFDGAANTSGEFNGVRAKLQAAIPGHIHTWCSSHNLNLSVSDMGGCAILVVSFFGLFQESYTFIKDSHKRIAVYMSHNPNFRLSKAVVTRWRSRNDATVKIFGRFHYWYGTKDDSKKIKEPVYMALISTLSLIGHSKNFDGKTRSTALSLLAKFTSYETIIVVAMTFLFIFQYTTPLSDYLQTRSLSYSRVSTLISDAQQDLLAGRDKFDQILAATDTFVEKMTAKLENALVENEELEEITIEVDFPAKRQIRVKRMAGEKASHEIVGTSGRERFRLTVFNVVMDTITKSLENRFSDHKRLYSDLSLFDPKNFAEMPSEIPPTALNRICELLPNVDKGRLVEELLSFARLWPNISKGPFKIDENNADMLDSHSEWVNENENERTSETEDETKNDQMGNEKFCKENKRCNACISCAIIVIYEYKMCAISFSELYKVYRFLLTIPMTQVSCERAFSQLKIIKTRLRSVMGQDNLEAFMLMVVERDILLRISDEQIIEKLCEKSTELRRLLST